jgi:alpha,alpha-trehalose phosphorylase (configuration-retaining)
MAPASQAELAIAPGGPPDMEQLANDLVASGVAGAAVTEHLGPMQPNLRLIQGLAGTAMEQTLTTTTTTPEITAPLGDAYTRRYDEATCEVHIESRLTLDDYKAVTPPDVWERFLENAEANRGKTIMRINATPYGGGVAIMNESWVHIMQLSGIDAHWYALDEDKAGSEVTKFRFHNGMQNVAPREEITLTDDDKIAYEAWIDRNAEKLEEPLRQADVIIIDDAQPSRLIRKVKGFTIETANGPVHRLGWNPDAPLIYRDHIHSEGQLMVTPGTPQYDIWNYLWDFNGINQADAFVIHPVDEFAPPNVPDAKIVKMPATVDKLGDLLRELSQEEIEEGFDFINDQLWKNEEQTPIDRNREYVVLIARFDESKGMPLGMESYLKSRELMIARGTPEDKIPQLLIIGNGAIDDPSGEKELAKVMALRSSEAYAGIKDDIKVARVPHKDMAINAILREAKLALQPSIAEGFEARVTDAIELGVPVIGSNRGGIPLQIKEGESGHVVDPHDTSQWAQRISELMTDETRYADMKATTAERAKDHNEQFTTIQNETNWLYLSRTLIADKDGFEGNRRWVSDMAAAESRF